MSRRRKNHTHTPSRFPWPKGSVVDTHTAAFHASREEKERARNAARKIAKPAVYNATLNLIARGEETDEASIVAEAAEVERASKAFHAMQDEKWTEEAA